MGNSRTEGINRCSHGFFVFTRLQWMHRGFIDKIDHHVLKVRTRQFLERQVTTSGVNHPNGYYIRHGY
jgi:hypothetical protein